MFIYIIYVFGILIVLGIISFIYEMKHAIKLPDDAPFYKDEYNFKKQ